MIVLLKNQRRVLPPPEPDGGEGVEGDPDPDADPMALATFPAVSSAIPPTSLAALAAATANCLAPSFKAKPAGPSIHSTPLLTPLTPASSAKSATDFITVLALAAS